MWDYLRRKGRGKKTVDDIYWETRLIGPPAKGLEAIDGSAVSAVHESTAPRQMTNMINSRHAVNESFLERISREDAGLGHQQGSLASQVRS